MRLIFHYLRKRKFLLFLNVLFAFSFVFAEIGIPFFFGRIIDIGINQHDPQPFFPVSGSLCWLLF